ncbi:MAG: orotidine-5'-phosphate decarboxylase [Pseudarcicella sp.]|nr:orotidine-5'-phosphate decarboxylase [Pseudarcicella sp.]MBP6411013.1 orotidine-5'-phosphate decarboxylase [Pseudarcicella sp.]
MTKQELFKQITSKQSFLCIGLDTDLQKIPTHLLKTSDPVFEFNKQIIDATHHLAVSYKPNIAFYEAMGAKGWESLQKTLEYIPKECFTIADAKRGDIGNTSGLYARAFFDKNASGLDFDSVTVAPYMGKDSVIPFLDFPQKWVILLALTSNDGSNDFQQLTIKGSQENGMQDEELFERVIQKSQEWGTDNQLMYVVGATKAEMLTRIRLLAPEHFLLVPGVGAQGGSLQEVAKYGMNSHCGLLVNSSRGIIYASNDDYFAQNAQKEAQKIQTEMAILIDEYLG